ncbi:hypothetical protein CCU68_16245 [Pseudomonas gingeri NCPPB 3146 = LMG 5327]|uniref:Uncharacterized protein n=1 Tax=Pseudomonas gingeri NCPPB 3146 = LMG 5327 TaxID=707248 RepID=A0ABX4Y4L9_9PSED|nr:hypothetical protein CCU68_16245 [Pseudomonas gingeri NCPPB 3146 = LMG 5327]
MAYGPHRWQASSYRGGGATTIIGVAPPNCGSRLAGDGVRSGDAWLMGLIAGKPAPTGGAGP